MAHILVKIKELDINVCCTMVATILSNTFKQAKLHCQFENIYYIINLSIVNEIEVVEVNKQSRDYNYKNAFLKGISLTLILTFLNSNYLKSYILRF